MANTKTKYIVGGIAVAAIVAAFAFSGTASASSRPAWTDPLDLPQTDEEWTEVKTAICTCARGGLEGRDLLVCALGKIYEHVPWASILDSGKVDGDHPSLHQAIEEIGLLVIEFDSLPDEAAREQWCPAPPFIKPVVFEKPDEPKPAVFEKPEVKTPQEVRAQRLNTLLSDIPKGGRFWIPVFQQYPNNISDTARALLSEKGIDSPSNSLVAALAGAISCPEWNAPYKRRKEAANETTPNYFFCNGWVVRPAYLPRNADAKLWVIQHGKRPPKTIKDNGAKKSGVVGADRYGMLWLPDFDAELAASGTLIITQPEPPEDFLALLS